MFKSFGLLLFALLTTALAAAQDAESLYSRKAFQLWLHKSNSFRLLSPDGRNLIVGKRDAQDDWVWRVSVFQQRHLLNKIPLTLFQAGEIQWAPDSKAFFWNYTDGGAVGTFHAIVVQLAATGVKVIEPIPNGRTLFSPVCFDKEWPNVGAIKWMKNSSALLIAVEVPPHGSCANMGTFRAFEITVPGAKVLRSYNQPEAKRRFADDIGYELRNADEECGQKPFAKDCIPPGLPVPNSAQRHSSKSH